MDPVGAGSGARFAALAPGATLDKRVYQVSWIDPAGPAARTELKVGDVIVRVDGIDITSGNAGLFHTLTRAAPGTKLTLTLQSGATVVVVLAAR